MGVGVFSADDGVHGRELWLTDGTAAGTVLVKDIRPNPLPSDSDSNPNSLIAVGGVVYFFASDGSASQLWRTDGTAQGTYALLSAAPADQSFANLARAGARLFFTSAQGLYVSDGTIGGTHLI